MGSEVGSEVVSGVVVGGVTSEVGEVTGADVVDGLAAVMTKVSTMNGKKRKGVSVSCKLSGHHHLWYHSTLRCRLTHDNQGRNNKQASTRVGEASVE